jgi:hypothetical protein
MKWRRALRWLKGSDREAAQGKDGIEAAGSWARHIAARDFPEHHVGRAVIVVEMCSDDGKTFPIYAGSEVEMSPIILTGLLASAQDMARQTVANQYAETISVRVVNDLLPQIVDQLGPPSREEVRKAVEGLVSSFTAK